MTSPKIGQLQSLLKQNEELYTLQWHKIFENSSYVFCIKETTDCGFVIVGSTKSTESKNTDIWVAKFNSEGTQQWIREIGGRDMEEGRSVVQTTDGGFVIAGHTKSKGSGEWDMLILKLDAQGRLLWDKTFGGSDWDKAFSIAQAADGGFVAVGFTYSKGAGKADVWAIRLDAQGKLLWEKTFGGQESEFGYSVTSTIDGGFVIVGSIESKGAGKADVWVIRLDVQGELLWDRIFGGSGLEEGHSVVQTTDGGFVIVGSTEHQHSEEWDMLVFKLDAKGNLLWDKTFGIVGSDFATSVVQTTNDELAITGSGYNSKTQNMNVRLIKLNEKGKLLWNRTFRVAGSDFATSIIQTSDRGLAIAGYSVIARIATGWMLKLSMHG